MRFLAKNKSSPKKYMTIFCTWRINVKLKKKFALLQNNNFGIRKDFRRKNVYFLIVELRKYYPFVTAGLAAIFSHCGSGMWCVEFGSKST